ncbi:MAG: DUF924 family protein [Pseudomonadales bacterium]
MAEQTNFDDILTFWFKETEQTFWFKKDAEFDELITKQFSSTLIAAKACELYTWRTSPAGRLAEIIVLDQFSRNIFRDHADAFAGDTLALALAQEAVANDMHLTLQGSELAFLLMPYMHSESKLIHEQAVVLFDVPGLESNLRFEQHHKVIIDRFGRYPHRNAVLGRDSTPEEIEFLTEPGSSF